MKVKIFQHIFRYKYTSVFFILGQLIMYITIFGALGIYNKAYQKEEDRLKAEYKNRIEMSILKVDKSDIISESGKDVINGNVILCGKITFFFREKNVSNRAEVIIKQNEDIPYEMVWGRLPGSEPEDYGRQVVAIGRYQYQYAYQENGRYYITIENEKYEVIGVIGNSNSDYLDYKMVFHINCVGNFLMDSINDMMNYTVELGSNEQNLEQSYKDVYNNLINKNSNVMIEAKKISGSGKSTLSRTLSKENIKINILIYIFTIICCMLMSEFWIVERKKEFVIKRTFGYGKVRIIMGILENIVELCLISFVIYICLHIINVDFVKIINYKITLNARTIISLVCVNIISLITTMMYPVYKIINFFPVNEIDE